MNFLLAVLLCLSAVLADEGFYPGGPHGATVCIEIRPSPHANPTKVCGPIVHGGPQQSSRPLQKAADPMVFNLPPAHHSSESDESREAQAPCGSAQKAMPSYPMRQSQPLTQPQPFMQQRMDMPPEGMLPMMAMDFDGAGWRQANPPCSINQRAAMPMGYPSQMMPPSMPPRPPMSMPNTRTWMVNSQHPMMMRAAEEPPMAMGMAMKGLDEKPPSMGIRASEEKPPSPATKKESLETLLKECEEKTKLLQEKEAKISELKTHIGANTKDDQETKKKE